MPTTAQEKFTSVIELVDTLEGLAQGLFGKGLIGLYPALHDQMEFIGEIKDSRNFEQDLPALLDVMKGVMEVIVRTPLDGEGMNLDGSLFFEAAFNLLDKEVERDLGYFQTFAIQIMGGQQTTIEPMLRSVPIETRSNAKDKLNRAIAAVAVNLNYAKLLELRVTDLPVEVHELLVAAE